jgi:NAD(P)-dependent dehydrogenase (short-subunit alcohol dehydrogenase family)
MPEIERNEPEPQVVAVTGATGNLGRAVIARLAAEGMRVIAVERRRVRDGAETLGDIDFDRPESLAAAFARIAERCGRLDAVVHTVGVYRGGPSLLQTPLGDFTELFATNVMATVQVLRAAIAVMLPQGQGRIAAVVSAAASAGRAGHSAYSATKAAQLRVIESAAQEVGGRGITLNAVLPGTMDTPQNRAAMPTADFSRWLRLEAVADVLAYLISPAASAIHGEAIRLHPDA